MYFGDKTAFWFFPCLGGDPMGGDPGDADFFFFFKTWGGGDKRNKNSSNQNSPPTKKILQKGRGGGKGEGKQKHRGGKGDEEIISLGCGRWEQKQGGEVFQRGPSGQPKKIK